MNALKVPKWFFEFFYNDMFFVAPLDLEVIKRYYIISFWSGYVLNGDGKECVDEDECKASNGRICRNGTYVC